MLYILYYTLGVLIWNGRTAFSTPVTYDQRQTGDVNVQIHLKDVQVVALLDSELLEDYTDYDYAYDYADFTIKPILRPTTSSSSLSTTSVKPWNTWPTNPPTTTTMTMTSFAPDSHSSTSNNMKPETTTKPTINHEAINGPSSDSSKANSTIYNLSSLHESNETNIKLGINDEIGSQLLNGEDILKTEEKQIIDLLAKSRGNSFEKPCPAGYALNKKGRCLTTQKRRRISLVPLTMKLGSKLSEKGRFAVRKDLPIRVYKSESEGGDIVMKI